MTVITQNGSKYDIYVDAETNQMRVKGTPIELVVTDLLNVLIGEHLVIKGYLMNPMTKTPRISLGKFSYTTCTITKILP